MRSDGDSSGLGEDCCPLLHISLRYKDAGWLLLSINIREGMKAGFRHPLSIIRWFKQLT